MQDDQIHINGKPATDAQLRKLTGLDKDTDLTQPVAEVVNFNWTEPDANGFQHLAPSETTGDFPSWTARTKHGERLQAERNEAAAELIERMQADWGKA